MKQDILIIGAGAAGLAAGLKLIRSGAGVTILEARDRTGGRIYTRSMENFSRPIEGGAEFVHGDLETTQSLLKQYNIKSVKTKGRWYSIKNGQAEQSNPFLEQHRLLERHLKEIKEDMSVQHFLDFHFPEITYKEFRQSVINFVEGYDAADASRASTLKLKEEWLNADDTQYRIENGYASLTDAMTMDFLAGNGTLHLNTIAGKVTWEKNHVTLSTTDGRTFSASKLICTVPPPLITDARHSAAISFHPPLPEIINHFSQIGYGTVIKTVLEFKEKFWESDTFKNAGWFLTNERIPTWWTQLPDETPVLTGWLAGPRAEALSHVTDATLLRIAKKSLSSLFKLPERSLAGIIKAEAVFNWKKDPFAAGAYTYATINRLQTIHELQQPVEDTIYFAGEALEPENTGTVEAALISGNFAAQLITG